MSNKKIILILAYLSVAFDVLAASSKRIIRDLSSGLAGINTDGEPNHQIDIPTIQIKFFILGDADVGKTVLLKKFFDEPCYNLPPTTGLGIITNTRQIGKIKVNLTFFETNEHFFHLFQEHARTCDGFLILFSARQPSILTRSEAWLQKIQSVTNGKKPVLLVLDDPKALAAAKSTSDNEDQEPPQEFFLIDLAGNRLTKAAINELLLQTLKNKEQQARNKACTEFPKL